ncbi:nucleotidyltransferase family protein [Dyadobacter sandarakinus]|uniref:Nucleotidyltransferase family protein n=1 Tax=Dyadobacter sandarakinus TaxID=2747268 RepID=A0ABX7IAX1_9BACT|nr:nucleotidyltransferase family protein [Dyadobacter sandarakinus]QRR02950.1 nucleotidyltransferase family protein [Dyadobacter sandarakinus]
MEKQTIISRLTQSKNYLFTKYPVKSLGLFGSYARNEAEADSDIDIIVEFIQPVGFEFVDLAIDLENILEQHVDLVSKRGIKPVLLPFIEKDIIYV